MEINASKLIQDLKTELYQTKRDRDRLAAKVEALEAGGGEIDNFTAPGSGPYSGQPVRLWMVGPGCWSDPQVWRDGLFVDAAYEGQTVCGLAQQNAKLWRPAALSKAKSSSTR